MQVTVSGCRDHLTRSSRILPVEENRSAALRRMAIRASKAPVILMPKGKKYTSCADAAAVVGRVIATKRASGRIGLVIKNSAALV